MKDTELTERAWAMLETLLETGMLELGNGQTRPASVREILSATQFVASRQVLKPKTVPLLDNLNLKRTDE
jgi:hypothetical protein